MFDHHDTPALSRSGVAGPSRAAMQPGLPRPPMMLDGVPTALGRVMSVSETNPAPQPAPTASRVFAIVVGNSLEFYDFLSFTFFAVNLARVMFPAGRPGTALLLTLMTGSLGFLARPFGAVLFGLLGDRIGRRPAMLATFSLMGVGALGLAATPSYATIGIAAPILVVVFRVVQGVAAGG